MKSFKLNNILLIIFCALTVSCAIVPEKKYIDIFEVNNLSERQIISEIELRKNKIAELKYKNQILENYNDKFKFQIDFDSSYSQDVSYLLRAYDKNKEIIDKNEIQIAKLNMEIRVLNRKKDLI